MKRQRFVLCQERLEYSEDRGERGAFSPPLANDPEKSPRRSTSMSLLCLWRGILDGFPVLPTPAPPRRDKLHWEAAFLFWWHIVDWLCTRFNRAIILLFSGCDKLAALAHGPESRSWARKLSSSSMEERKNRFSAPSSHFHLGSTIYELSFPKQRYQFTNWRALNDTEVCVCFAIGKAWAFMVLVLMLDI